MPQPLSAQCSRTNCTAPATMNILTRLLGTVVGNGVETKICRAIEDTPKRGWSKATPMCQEHGKDLLAVLADTLG